MELDEIIGGDVIDVRDLIERFEELEDSETPEDREELKLLASILSDLEGNGGDEEWRDDWYPVNLIRDSYFTKYTQEFAEECYEIPNEWPFCCINWEQAASELQMDYMSTEICGITYWFR